MRTHPVRHARTFLAALACLGLTCLGLTACSAAPTTSLRVIVRDARSNDPLPGVIVTGETCSRDHPFSIASLLGQTGPRDQQVRTGPDGRAALTVLADWPIRLTAIGPDHRLGQLWLEVPLPDQEVPLVLDPEPSAPPQPPIQP